MPDAAAVLARLRAMAGPAAERAGMARFGIDVSTALGIRIPALRKLAREVGRDHQLAAALWASGIHEARILAAYVDEPARVTPAQMERWARSFRSWDVCDQVCANLFDRTPHAAAKARAWMARDEEFVKRAGFALVAALAWHDDAMPDAAFVDLLRVVEANADDPRNFVKKAASWALRQTGKRNARLRREAVAVARRLAAADGAGARWVGRDALRELASR